MGRASQQPDTSVALGFAGAKARFLLSEFFWIQDFQEITYVESSGQIWRTLGEGKGGGRERERERRNCDDKHCIQERCFDS